MSAAGVTVPAGPSPLDRGRLRARLAAGEATLGTFVGAASPVTAEACAAAGVDWLVLDLGAVGVMLPRMDGAQEVREAVRHLRYPPHGDRGVATYNRACRFGLDPDALGRARHELLGVVQVESASAVEQVEQIAAIDGVDVLFVGPQDLSHNLGVPGDLQAPAYLAAIERVRAAAGRHGKACGLLVRDGATAAARQAEGWTFVAIGSDTTLLAAAVAGELGRARQPASTPGGRR
jgi:2-dehydro-3-deoxyglucarate aldolase/4-hydroxy-2-oxoheptanedioate aldolase